MGRARPAASPARARGAVANGHAHAAEAEKHAAANGGTFDGRMLDSRIYGMCLSAAPPCKQRWFSLLDVATRSWLAVGMFYRLLITEPLPLILFAYRWNRLWYGRIAGLLLTLTLPAFPAFLWAVEAAKRLNEALNPWIGVDWKMQGPGRVFFVRPDGLVASLLWDFYLAISVFACSYLQYGTDPQAIDHCWYDSVCTKEYWNTLLDAAGARRPRQLGYWDGATLQPVGKGVGSGSADLVTKICDSYLGIGDRVLGRGGSGPLGFKTHADVHAILAADPEYAGRPAMVCELVSPATGVRISSSGFGNTHSLDLITMRTRRGVQLVTALLWTDCDGWSSHTCSAGYIIDVETETIVAPTAWYSPHFATQKSSLVGARIPGAKEACAAAVRAHEACKLPWMTTIGWDAMLTDDGVCFFEGNVSAYRTPRRVFLSPGLAKEFYAEWRGVGSPVP